MRTNIVIDDRLMDDALKATGLETKKEVVALALETLVRLKRQAEIKRFRGKIAWSDDEKQRRSRR